MSVSLFCNCPLILWMLIQSYTTTGKTFWKHPCFKCIVYHFQKNSTFLLMIHIYANLHDCPMKCRLEPYMSRPRRCALLDSSSSLTVNVISLCVLSWLYVFLHIIPFSKDHLLKKKKKNRFSWNLDEVVVMWQLVFRGVLLNWDLGEGLYHFFRLRKYMILTLYTINILLLNSLLYI